MSSSSNDRPQSPSNQKNVDVLEEPSVPSTSGVESVGLMAFDTVGSTEEAANISLVDTDKSVETRVSDNMNESRVLKLDNGEVRVGDASGGAPENQPTPSVSSGQGNGKKRIDLRNDKSEHKKGKNAVEDYDSMLSEFDQFAAKGVGEAVGYGYEIGDMVWGKVKSHPWWPGHIYNEAFASPSVQRSKREGHVLVAFFGDSSYGWFDLAELVPFEENFAEKSRQTSSRAFAKAVGEAVDELSRRKSLGLACRCRNEFNFWPSTVENSFVVDVGDYEPGVFSMSQINKARESFQPKEMLSFVQQLASAPMTNLYRTIEFIKSKATVLACRKALFEEFDETYAQAFGTVPVCPPRPTAPMSVDPSKAPLSGRLVFAEALGKGKSSIKHTKPKEQVEKDKYLFKRRDEPVHMKTKKTSSGQIGLSADPLLIDGSGLSRPLMDSRRKGHMHQASISGINDCQQSSSDLASMASDTKPSESSKKIVEGGMKKAKVQRQYTGELDADNITLDLKKKKRKKEISTEQHAVELSAENVKKRKKAIRGEASADNVQLPLANINNEAAVDKVAGMLLDGPVSAANNQIDNQKDDEVASSSSLLVALLAVDSRKLELTMLVRDLRALSLDPFHGVERGCPGTVRSVFLKFRSLVYQKSLVLLPQAENETSESHSNTLPASTDKTKDKSTTKLTKPSVRLDDPTKGGKKRGPSERSEAIKKKKQLDDSGDIKKRKKLIVSGDIKKKKIVDESKLLAVDKKNPQRFTESQRGDLKDIVAKKITQALPKAVKSESSKRGVPSPTMLVMKFPAGAALPSGAELRAKFARFGPLDHAGTRVFWKSYTCRLVYQQKFDAEAALKFAVGSSHLFGNPNVRCYIREVGMEVVESELVKVQNEDPSAVISQPRDSIMAVKIAVQPNQQSLNLKSCLKKPSGEEIGGNGNGRGTRVKFILGGEGSTKTEQVSSFPEGASSSSSYTHSMDVTSKNLPKFIPHSSVTPLPAHHFHKVPINMPLAQLQQIPSAPTYDISQQLLNLLTRCSDVVNNLTGVLGYVPYHSL